METPHDSRPYWEEARANGQRAVDFANRMLGDSPQDVAEAQALLGEVPPDFNPTDCLRRQLDPLDPCKEDKARYALSAHVDAGRMTQDEMDRHLRLMKRPMTLGILGDSAVRSFIQRGLQRPVAHSPNFFNGVDRGRN